jgi:hypothetical protein
MQTTPTGPKYVDPKNVVLKEHAGHGQMVHFEYFRDEEFWYRTDKGLLFPIALKEAMTGRPTLPGNDKAIYYMRWIKRYVEACKQDPTEAAGFTG